MRVEAVACYDEYFDISFLDTLQDIKFAVHAHPTLSEVLDELFKSAKVNLQYLLLTTD